MWTLIGKSTGAVQSATADLEGRFKSIHFALMGYMVVTQYRDTTITADRYIQGCLQWFDDFCWTTEAVVFDNERLEVKCVQRTDPLI